MANTIRIQVRQISASTSEALVREHRVLVDRPEAKGGSNAGPMGGELFLAAVGGCFLSNLLAAVRPREADISDMSVEVVGSLADAPPRFERVELHVSARCGDMELLARLVDIADRGCIMMNTLRAMPGVTVSIGALS